MHADDVVALTSRLFLAGPLLYAGLVMTFDCGRFLESVEILASVIQRFSLDVYRSRQPRPEFMPFEHSPSLYRKVRLTGMLLVVFGIIHLAGLAH